MNPLQPPDETPLVAGSLASYSPRLENSLPELAAQLAAGERAAVEQVQQQIDQTYAELQFATNDVHQAVAEELAQQSQLMQATADGIDRAVIAADEQTMAALNKVEDSLVQEGVAVPIGHPARVDLLAGPDSAIDATIPGASSSPPPCPPTNTTTGRDEGNTGQYRLCTSYPTTPPWVAGGFGLYDSAGVQIAKFLPDPWYAGNVIAAPLGGGCPPEEVIADYPPLPAHVGDRCYGLCAGGTGVVIRDPRRPGRYLCSADGVYGAIYNGPVIDGGTLVQPGSYQWPTSSTSTPTTPAGSGSSTSPPPSWPTSSPPASPLSPPGVPQSSLHPPVSPPLVPPPANTISSENLTAPCPAPVVQCPAPVVNVTVACPPGGSVTTTTNTGATTTTTTNTTTGIAASPPTSPPGPPAPPVIDLTGPIPPRTVDLTGVQTGPPTVDLTQAIPTTQPAPPLISPPAALAKDQHQIDWTDPDACTLALSLCSSIGGLTPAVDAVTFKPAAASDNWWNQIVTVGSLLTQPGVVGLNSLVEMSGNKGVATGTSSSIATAFQVFATMAVELLGKDAGPAIHNRAAASYYSGKLGMVNFVSKWSGIPLDWYFTSDSYTMRFCDPQLLPSQAEATAGWLRNTITSDEWDCLTKANGNILPWAKRIRDAAQTIPNVGESVQAYYRGLLKTKRELYEQLRRQGVTDTKFADQWVELAKWLPGPSDLVRFMVRDVNDPEVVAKFNYDKDYTKKFGKEIKQWAEQQGVTEDVFKFAWRAHWEIPSNTALYDMLHRLRPDRPAVERWRIEHREWETGGGFGPEPVKPPIVTVDEIKYAVEVNDLSPSWVDPTIAISYRPITNTDARRMYQTTLIDRDELVERFRDNGYTEDDARALVTYESALKNRQLATMSGVLSVREIVRAYQEGCLTRRDSMAYLHDQIPDEKDRTKLLDNVDRKQTIAVCRSKMKALRKQFLFGKMGQFNLLQELLLLGLEPNRAQAKVDEWFWDRENRLKEPRLAMLCKWYRDGYISNVEYLNRLRNLGYGDDDAYKIANVCWSDEVVKRSKAAVAAAESNYRDLLALQKSSKRDLSDELANLALQIKTRKAELAALTPPLPAPPVHSRNGRAGGPNP